ncbi:Polyadenylate-binding protein 5 [Platanthera guangdongensis]|uniref:Polyadenylate-binding protein 5 n=1 Tax=Platanthera guangdongensis TaxID=2320717 RepID=A0ABR2MJ57_9ASPA
MPPTQKKIVRTIRRAKAPNPTVSLTVAAYPKTPASEPSPAAFAADAAATRDPAIEDACEPLPTALDASVADFSISKEASSMEPLATETLAAETTLAKPLAKPGTKIIKRVKKIVRKKVVPAALAAINVPNGEDLHHNTSIEPLTAEALSLDPAGKTFSEPQARHGQKTIIHVREISATESPPAADATGPYAEVAPSKASLEPESTISEAANASIATLTTSEHELKAAPSTEHISVERAGLESSDTTTTAKPRAKSRPRIIKIVRKVVRKKAVPEHLPIINATPTIEDVGEPEPEPEKETVATASSISSLPASELASEKAPSIKTLATEVVAVEPTEAGLKAIKRVRKVVRKKIVKKLVPKGSVTAKKVDAIPKQEDTENTAKFHKVSYPSPIRDNSIRPEAAVSLPETNYKDPKLNGIQQSKLARNGLKSQMEEAEKLVSVESDNSMMSKKCRDQVKAKGNILDCRKSSDRAEVLEFKEDDLEGLSERMKRRKAEIFVGGLDRSAKEEDLKRVFGKVGEILEVRMMMDGQTGKNKGYAFMRYADPSQAKRAVAELTRVEICGKTCGAAAVQSDAIFIGNIDKKWRDEDVIKLLKEAGVENIDTVKVVMDSNNIDSNRGYAFLELETNADAQRAYKKLQKKDFFGKGRNIKVSWADSFTVSDDEEMKKVKSVYAEGVPDSWDEVKLMDSFKKFGEIERIVLSRNIKSANRTDFAFINYKTRDAALSCIRTFRNDELSDNGSKINLTVALAKRVQKVKQNKGQNSTNNYVLKEKYNPVQGFPDFVPYCLSQYHLCMLLLYWLWFLGFR